jgi:hypothetical protein
MAACCCSGSENTVPTLACPLCRTNGSSVDELTVKAVLTESALRQFEPAAHRFCAVASCDVVYFDAVGRTFTTTDVRVSVWQKASPGARTICYCFGENETDIRNEIQLTGGSKAVERIRADIDAGRCACEVRNPKGACCLGDVTQIVQWIADHGT